MPFLDVRRLAAVDMHGTLLRRRIILAEFVHGALACHASQRSHRGALDAELRGVDLPRELRRYTRLQFWIAVPLLFVGLAAVGTRD
jgi:hypothetical protein